MMKNHFAKALTAILAFAVLPGTAGTTTDKVGATNIHKDGYLCEWFEDTTFPGDQKNDSKAQPAQSTSTSAEASQDATSKADLLKYAIISSSGYVDRNDRDHGKSGSDPSGCYMNGDQGRVDNWKLVNGVTEMSGEEVRKLIGDVPGLKVESAILEADEVRVGEKATKKADIACQQSAQWERVETTMITGRDKDGLSVRVFEDEATGAIILSFRGTADGKDLRDDIKQVLPVLPTPQQYKDAAKVLKAVLENPAYKDKKIVCTGHSLGGGLVQYAMAENNIMDGDGNSRVQGYVYNSAGLNGFFTVNSFDTEKAKNAAANIVGVRNDGDPVSFVGYHLLAEKKMYELTTEVDREDYGEHSIASLIQNMAASMSSEDVHSILKTDVAPANADLLVSHSDQAMSLANTTLRKAKIDKANAKKVATPQKGGSGPTGGSGPIPQTVMSTTSSSGIPPSIGGFFQTQISTNPDVQSAFDDAFDKIRIGLDTVLSASMAQDVADKLEELAKKGVVAAGNAADKAIQAQIDKLKAEIMAKMPGDASKAQMGKVIDELLNGLGSGNFSTLPGEIGNLGTTLAGDYASRLVDGLNLPAAEKAALKKTVSDAVQAYINGSGVGGSIKGNIEAYIYGKIQAQFGKDVADAWKNAYYTWQGGKNPWADIGAAARKTIESWAFQKLEKVIDASLKKLLDNHPFLAEMFKALGIDTGAIMGTIKNIWGVLTGPGDLAAKFKELSKLAVEGLANMLKSLVHWALDKFQAWLNGFLSKIGKKIGDWIKDKVSSLLAKLHLSQSLIDKAMKAIDAAIGAGAKYVSSLPSKLEKPIGGIIDKGAKKINEKISGKAAPQQQNANPQQQKKKP